MLVGWAITSLSMAMLLFFSDLSKEAVEVLQASQATSLDGDAAGDAAGYVADSSLGGTDIMDGEAVVNGTVIGTGGAVRSLQSLGGPVGAVVGDPPSIPFLSFALLLFGTGFWFADVMGDSVVAEKAKLEPEGSRGHLQSTCYACRFFGLMLAAPLSTVIYSAYGARYVVLLMAALPAAIVPLVLSLKETRNVPVASTREQCGEIWSTVCSRAVWQPMGFVYLYNVLQV